LAQLIRECPHCQGTGQLPDSKKVGAHMRNARRQRGLTLLQLAVRMGYTQPYLSDLELGKRMWSLKLMKRYEEALIKEIAPA